jgi:2-polyprenyl-3-methyl-5-hydroxy-6-metoxy-1,4-benzoquinol methylase
MSISDDGNVDSPADRCLSVVMPCFNEEATISTVITRVLASPYVNELIVVDDGSSDESVPRVRAFGDPRLRLLRQPVNLGKGAALRRGFAEATSPYVVIQDADLEYDPDEFGLLLRPLLDGAADVVYGSRFAYGRPRRVLYFWHSVGNKALTLASNMLTNLNLSDIETCYKAFRREVVQSLELEEDRFGIEPEITAKVAAGGWRVWEVSISYAGRTYAEGKKIGARDIARALYAILRYSAAWARVRGRVDRVPDRGESPASFEDADSELSEVLASLENADNYTEWIYTLIKDHLGRRVLEIGAGHGSLTAHLERGRHVTATDLSGSCVQRLRERFANCPNVEVLQADLADMNGTSLYDSIILVNVLEHLDDDVAVLRTLRGLLAPGGSICIFVPAFEGLYSEFDRRVGHRRRYRRTQLIGVLDRAGYSIVDARYVNTVGAVAWWLLARRLNQIPTQNWSVRLYDRVVVPPLRRLESRGMPRFGQSLLGIGRRSAEMDRQPGPALANGTAFLRILLSP